MILDISRKIYYKDKDNNLTLVKEIDLASNYVTLIDGKVVKYGEFDLCNVVE